MLTITTTGELKRIPSDTKRVQYEYNGSSLLPEEVAQEHYKKLGYQVIWTENDYWSVVLSLLFWDVIFAKVEGAVRDSHPDYDDKFNESFEFQIQVNGMPTDLFSTDFADNRRDLIIARCSQLLNMSIEEELIRSYKAHYGENCRLVILLWDKFSIDELVTPIRSISKTQLIRIFVRLLGDISEYRSGFPDLIATKDESATFIEVKSENDNLSQGQRGWLNYLSLDVGIDTELFLINPPDKKLKKLQESFLILLEPITIQLGETTSKLKKDMVELFAQQDSYVSGKNPSASFSVFNNEIKRVVTTVGRWRTTRFYIKGKEYSVQQIRNAVYEYYGNRYFNIDHIHFGREYNDYGCRKFNLRYVNHWGWKGYGYIDTTTEDWVFNKDKINQRVSEELELNALCPYIDVKKIKKYFSAIPDRVDPKNDSEWGYIDVNSAVWLYQDGRWVTDWHSHSSFEGTGSVVGVKRFSMYERKDFIDRHEKEKKLYEELYDDVDTEDLVETEDLIEDRVIPRGIEPPKTQSVAIILSLFLGFLGIDRMYLGHIGTGILKLLTFGGFGIWWAIDIILILTKALRPKDGSDFTWTNH